MVIDTLLSKLTRIFGALAVVAMLAGCASSDSTSDSAAAVDEVYDPIEGVNRFIFDVNLGLDTMLFRPVAALYDLATPTVVQNMVRNFLDNLRTPVILANDLMQGEFARAWDTTARFGINSTAGVGGLFDWAEDWGFKQHDEDFGQTLGAWGVGSGPYLVLPLFGPSNARDAVGRTVDMFLDPFNWFAGFDYLGVDSWGKPWETADLIRDGVDALDTRARNLDAIADLQRNSLDFYATVRSLYEQRRNDQIRNGEVDDNIPVPSISQTSQTSSLPGLNSPAVGAN